MEINIINNSEAKLINKKDGLNMIITRQSMSNKFIATSYYESNHKICYKFMAKQIPNDVLIRVIQSPAQKYSSIYKRNKNNLSLEYYYHHSLDMIRGFFASNKYKNSAFARLSNQFISKQLKNTQKVYQNKFKYFTNMKNMYKGKLTKLHSQILSVPPSSPFK